ncbi:Beta-catenin-like protein 1, partial [Perkinsus olseni]
RLRIKHSDDPTKFLESEVSLAEEIRRLTELAVNPAELYPAFIAAHGGRVVVGLLQHANVDICAEALAVLSDLTEPEVMADCEDKVAGDFVESLVTDAKLPSIYIETLWRIYREQGEQGENSEEESGAANDAAGKMEDAQQATTNCLQTIENLFEIWPAKTVPEFCTGRFVEWLVTVIKEADFKRRYNALFASELLSLLLQQCPSPSQTVPQMVDRRSLDRLLRVTNMYRHSDPKESSENELLENVFDALVLVVPYHQTAFGQSQGVQLMVKLLSQGAGKRLAARLSLRVLEAALRDHQENCKLFVEQMGLKSIFGLLAHRKATDAEMETTVNIIYHLLHNTKGSEAARVLNKFTEGSFSKIDVLAKLREDTRRHLERRLAAYDEEGEERKAVAEEEDEDEIEQDPKEARYVFALGNGLSQLQLIDLCLLLLCHNSGNKALTEHL